MVDGPFSPLDGGKSGDVDQFGRAQDEDRNCHGNFG